MVMQQCCDSHCRDKQVVQQNRKKDKAYRQQKDLPEITEKINLEDSDSAVSK